MFRLLGKKFLLTAHSCLDKNAMADNIRLAVRGAAFGNKERKFLEFAQEEIMKRYALVLTLVVALAASFGCAKKTTVEPGTVSDQGENPELRAAVQTITDSRVYFAFNKYNIQNQYDETLRRDAEVMKQFPSIRVRIEGNCDERGTQEYNLALGERRARAAYDYLVSNGVNPGQLEMISYGKENPAVLGSGEAVWSKNRRDDFRVIAQ